jgi:PEP-CTERM motif
MFRMKALAAAVLVATSGVASAAMDLPSTGTSSLFLMAYDNVALRTYSFDTGLSYEQFFAGGRTAGTGVTTAGTTFSFTLPSFSTFLAGLDTANVRWGVFGGDQNQSLGPTGAGVMMTGSGTGGTVAGNTRVANINGNNSNMINDHNFLGTHPTAANGWAIKNSDPGQLNSDGGYGGRMLGSANNFNGNTSFNVTGAIGDSLNFFLFDRGTPLVTTKSTFQNALGNATWTLSSNGNLVYTAPVPEPGTYAMMLAGLLTLGAVARRRMK